jgi:hypothetical protein
MRGIATVIVAWNGGRVRLVNAPRTIITRLPRGTVFGAPGEVDQQNRVLDAALALLTEAGPLEPIYLEESIEPAND